MMPKGIYVRRKERYRPRILSMTKSAISLRKFHKKYPTYNAERQRKYLKDHPEKLAERRLKEKLRRLKDPRNSMVKSSWVRAGQQNLSHNITIEDIIIPKFCPVLGIRIKKTLGKRTGHSPSLDRIIPKLGYVKGNIIVISWRANDLKKDASVEELQLLAKFYKKLCRCH